MWEAIYMKILCCGGGTMGPVTPLLAVLRRMKARRADVEFAWVGTPDGPERAVLEAEGITFYPLTVVKLPRHPSTTWLVWPFLYLQARREATRILTEVRPALVLSAGGFSSVPVIAAAHRYNIPCAIHQLDAEPGLANRAVAKKCQLVTTSFAYDFPPFPGVASEQVPTPCRFTSTRLPSRTMAASSLRLDPARPIVFVVGGGTGATALNEAIWNVLPTLTKDAQVIHLTGRGKIDRTVQAVGYLEAEFFDENQILSAYAAADLVVSRAGLGVISELAALSKAAIFVPIPDSHQELNVKKLPCAVIQQGQSFSTRLLQEIRRLLEDEGERQRLGKQLHQALPTDNGEALAERWMKLLK